MCAKKSMEKIGGIQGSVKSSLCYCESFYTEFLQQRKTQLEFIVIQWLLDFILKAMGAIGEL